MIFDLHNDFSTKLASENYYRYLNDNMRDGTRITAAIWTSEFGNDAFDRVLKITDDLTRLSGIAPVPVAIEDICFLAEHDRYKKFEFGKYLYCSLTWNYDNEFAGGALGVSGLTAKGKNVIEYMSNCGCVLDLAHLNIKSFYAALDCVKTAVCSHTGFNSHPRSLDESQIKALTERNGLIGLCTVTAFSSANNALDFAQTIDGFVQKYGADNLALGTDFYGSSDIPSDLDEYGKFESVKTNLSSRGYTQNDIDKIFYINAQKFFEKG